jgi:predicted transcriptional regulator
MKIMGAVRLLPGIHLRELHRVVGLSFTSARYHVSKMVQAGDMEYYSHKGKVRLFPPGVSESEKAILSEVRNNTANVVLKSIATVRLTSNAEISRATGLARSTVSKYVHIFMNLGVLGESRTPGGTTGYIYKGSVQIPDLLRFGKENLRAAVDSYIDLWDF